MKAAPIIFGIILVVIWIVMKARDRGMSIPLKDPKDLVEHHRDVVMRLERLERLDINTAVLTAGLISIAFGLAG